jgi:hypothetical protein
MLLVHSATERCDQIVKLFLAAHHKPLWRFPVFLVSIATAVSRCPFLYGLPCEERYLNS